MKVLQRPPSDADISRRHVHDPYDTTTVVPHGEDPQVRLQLYGAGSSDLRGSFRLVRTFISVNGRKPLAACQTADSSQARQHVSRVFRPYFVRMYVCLHNVHFVRTAVRALYVLYGRT